jgi:hypothetical protein
MEQLTFNRIAMTALLLASSGCTSVPGLTTTQRPTISVQQGGAITVTNRRIELTPEKAVLQLKAVKTFPYTITLDAQVPRVMVGGKVTEAADVAISKDGALAAIAYNTAGEPFGGAVQLVDIHDVAAPKILRQIEFPNMDVNCVTLDGGTLYFGGAANPDVWSFRSFVGSIDVQNPTSSAITNSLRGLRSYGATAIVARPDRLYVGVGARDGGIELFDKSLRSTGFVASTDVRALAVDGNDVVALAGTTDGTATTGKIFHVDDTTKTTPIANFGSDYAKATLEVDSKGLSLLALSASGLSVLSAGKEIFKLSNPGTDKTVATNGASMDDNLIFSANGEYGFRVLQVLDRAATGAAFASVVGFHAPEVVAGTQKASANFLRYKAGTLAVAEGVSGLGLYHVEPDKTNNDQQSNKGSQQ